VLPALLLATLVAVPAALWSRLPARVADHWTLTGTANSTAPKLAAFLLLGVLAVVGIGIISVSWSASRYSVLAAPGRPGARSRSGMMSIGLFITALAAALTVMMAVANLGGGGLASASVGVAGLAASVGGPVLFAAMAGYLLRRYGGLDGADSGEPRASLGLRAGERAVWTGRARAGWARPAGVLIVVAGALVAVVAARWVAAVPLLLIGLSLLAFTSIRVTVAARGVTVGYGPLGLRLTRIPLRRIASAEAVDRSPFAFGYRGSLLVFGAAAVVVRPGPALRLTLRDGKTFLVTVDDAATGAALLNDLISGAAAA
jgi:hypothetical protein